MKAHLSALLVLFSLSSITFAQDCNDVKGVWQDEKGVSISIEKLEDGFFSGYLQLSPNIDTFKYQIAGVVNKKKSDESNDSAIAFSVNWAFLGSVSSYAGVCESQNNSAVMKLLVHQVKASAHAKNERISTDFTSFHAKK